MSLFYDQMVLVMLSKYEFYEFYSYNTATCCSYLSIRIIVLICKDAFFLVSSCLKTFYILIGLLGSDGLTVLILRLFNIVTLNILPVCLPGFLPDCLALLDSDLVVSGNSNTSRSILDEKAKQVTSNVNFHS